MTRLSFVTLVWANNPCEALDKSDQLPPATHLLLPESTCRYHRQKGSMLNLMDKKTTKEVRFGMFCDHPLVHSSIIPVDLGWGNVLHEPILNTHLPAP
jgi:hypothetical protein